MGEERQQDSPVLYAVPELAELGAVKEHEARISSLQRERDLLKAQLDVSEKTSLTNQATLEAMRQAIEELGKRLSEPQRKAAEVELESLVQAKRVAAPSVRLDQLSDMPVDVETIFVLMPFSADFAEIYDTIRDTALDVGLRCFRADAISAAGPIIDQIFESIAKIGLIVADLTGRNQNVMYELGLASAMGKQTLLLSQDIQDVPFDVRHQRVLTYKLTLTDIKTLRGQLFEAFKRYRSEAVAQQALQRRAASEAPLKGGVRWASDEHSGMMAQSQSALVPFDMVRRIGHDDI